MCGAMECSLSLSRPLSDGQYASLMPACMGANVLYGNYPSNLFELEPTRHRLNSGLWYMMLGNVPWVYVS